MDENNKKEMSLEDMEQDFKKKMFEAFSSKMPGVHYDEDGFIVVPMRVRRRNPTVSDDSRASESTGDSQKPV